MAKVTPLVSVLMPVYNGAKYLEPAIKSILNQTFTDFEFIVINDGSIDNSEEIIKSFNDERIRYILNEKNLRLINTLNKGLKLAKGKYIARMDADDIAREDRFEKQFYFMETNPDVGLLGSYYYTFSDNENILVEHKTPYLKDCGLRFRLLFSSTLRHPVSFFRTSVLQKGNITYDLNYLHSEEHRFWVEIAKYSKVASIPEFLLKFRLHHGSVTSNDKAQQIQADSEVKIRTEQLEPLIGHLDNEKSLLISEFLEFFRFDRNKFLERSKQYSLEEIIILNEIILSILEENKKKKVWDEDLLKRMFLGKLKDILIHHSHLGLTSFKLYSAIANDIPFGFKIKFLIKCFLRKNIGLNFYLTSNY